MLISTASHTQDIAGPSVDDPLTSNELAVLLALPRAARISPESLFVRLPKGATPSEGHIDVSCSQACSIVARLASAWRTRTHVQLGPGTTVCLMIDPYMQGIFHHLAFWALGCTVQYTATLFEDQIVDAQLEQSGCKVIVYLGKTDVWVKERRKRHVGIEMVALDEREHASMLACSECAGLGPAPEWPTPKRPSPAIIVQSSATTSTPKLLRFSLHYYMFSLAADYPQHLASRPPPSSCSPKRPETHPQLIASAPFWQAFHGFFLTHLVTATPFTLVPAPELFSMSANELAEWIKELDAGGLVSAPFSVRDIILNDTHTKLLQSMYSINMLGNVVDEQLSNLISQKGLKATNIFGMSELGGFMMADRPPYMHLRPIPNLPSPLAVPVSDSLLQHHPAVNRSSGPPGRAVQLWHIVSRCPHLAHISLRGGVPLKLEPFPGLGPHMGEPAMNLGAVFYETRSKEGEKDDISYVYLGRTDDYLRLSIGDLDINASLYELEIGSLIGLQLAKASDGKWRLDTVQLFGANLLKTALVVQLLSDCETQVDNKTMDMIRQCVGEANNRLGLTDELRVNPMKRMLVTIRATSIVPPAAGLYLLRTHKRSLKRWQNAEIFSGWLDQLDWS